MQHLSRRSFLRGSAAVLAPVSIAAAAAPSVLSSAPEGARLLQLGNDLEEAAGALRLAESRKREARTHYERIAPQPPEELIVRRGEEWSDAQDEMDVEGERILTNGRFRRVMYSSGLRIDVEDYRPRTKAGRAVRQRLKIAESYEAAIERAKIDSGIGDAIEARYWAAREVHRISEKIVGEPARTTAGLAVKARALILCQSLEPKGQYWSMLYWGPTLAENILAVTDGTV